MARFSNVLLIATVSALIMSAMAFRSFQRLLPNGNMVPCPPGLEFSCLGDICPGVGHTTCFGGGPRNPFGMAFAAAGRSWTVELCLADSDGDSVPNGVELGDPCCLFDGSNTDALMATMAAIGEYPLSHPGFATSSNADFVGIFNETVCADLAEELEVVTNMR